VVLVERVEGNRPDREAAGGLQVRARKPAERGLVENRLGGGGQALALRQ
jgi:hypothetical protein